MTAQAVPLKCMIVPLSPPANMSVSEEPQMHLRFTVVPVSICSQSYWAAARQSQAESMK